MPKKRKKKQKENKKPPVAKVNIQELQEYEAKATIGAKKTAHREAVSL